jgi:glucoamylase
MPSKYLYIADQLRYLITTAAAEFLYDAVAQWKARHNLYIDETSLAFFRDLYPAANIQKYNSGNKYSPFAQIMDAVTAYADSFLAIAEKYTPADGHLAEQFNRETGAPLSAADLTWSYAAFITMAQRRAGQYPASWGSRKATPPPTTCAGTSTPGVYTPATAAGAPNVTSSCQINVIFNVNASTYFGENIYVVGNTSDLGAWDINNAYPLGSGQYTKERPLWSVSAFLNAGESVDYKYVRQEDCGQPYIYETLNRTLVVPGCGSEAVTTDDAWTGPVGTSGGC